ncbi:MAG: hypothetical protein V6Z86_07275 [Hyphomicrobiales bacterium]
MNFHFHKRFGGLSDKPVHADDPAELAICENPAAAKDHANESRPTTYAPSGNEAAEWKHAASQYRLLTQKIETIDDILKVLKTKRDKHLALLKDLIGAAVERRLRWTPDHALQCEGSCRLSPAGPRSKPSSGLGREFPQGDKYPLPGHARRNGLERRLTA